MTSLTSHSEAETLRIARDLAARLQAGDVVLLVGPLAAGKTVFVRGLAEGLGANPDEVSSPTFMLIQEYRGGRLTLVHVDLYRLAPAEVDDLGLEELGSGNVALAIEWADRLPRPIGDAITVRIEDAGNDRREIAIETYSNR